jgi:hypothetical protein
MSHKEGENVALEHVSIWDPESGYRHISIEEAEAIHPEGVSSARRKFACELCGQYVTLTQKGENKQHFRHQHGPDKYCVEKEAGYLYHYPHILSRHPLPLRVIVNTDRRTYSLQLGFTPLPEEIKCEKIHIETATGSYDYNFSEHIFARKISFVNVGPIPSASYNIEYVDASDKLKNFWPNYVEGIESKGALFEKSSGKKLVSGSKAYFGQKYYLLCRHKPSTHSDITFTEIAEHVSNSYTYWHIYEVSIENFSKDSADFFMRYSVFLSSRPSKLYPIWPACVVDPNFVYYSKSTNNTTRVYFYMSDGNDEVKLFPCRADGVDHSSGDGENSQLVGITADGLEQLVSIGMYGSRGFTYLYPKNEYTREELPRLTVCDIKEVEISEELCFTLPKSGILLIDPPFDGKVVVRRNGKVKNVVKLSGGTRCEISGIIFGTVLELYQGCDLIKVINFKREEVAAGYLQDDNEVLKRLQNAGGSTISVPHSLGAALFKFSAYPKTQAWLIKTVKSGKMTAGAYKATVKYAEKFGGQNV